MKTKGFIYKLQLLSAIAFSTTFMASCSNEPEGDDLFTETGKTINSYITEDADLTSFEYILSRVKLDRTLDAYGNYTCFAPTNAGVAAYIDSLWNDTEARFEHNGLSSNSLEGLNDSLCNDIARYHLVNGNAYNVVSLESKGSVTTGICHLHRCYRRNNNIKQSITHSYPR